MLIWAYARPAANRPKVEKGEDFHFFRTFSLFPPSGPPEPCKFIGVLPDPGGP
jgi:hypothetical protein